MDYRLLSIKVWSSLQPAFVVLFVVLIGVWAAQLTWSVVSPPNAVTTPRVTAAASGDSDGTNWLQLGRDVGQREFFAMLFLLKMSLRQSRLKRQRRRLI